MLTPALASISKDNFSLEAESNSDTVCVKLMGNCEMDTTPVLETFLSQLHLEAPRIGAKRVVMDCQDLYFMNSASIKCLVAWVQKVSMSPNDVRYTVEFVANQHLSWQQRSLGAIERFAPHIVSLNQEGGML